MSTLATDPVWADVVPIPAPDGPSTVANIAYSDAFRDTMGYFRAVLASKERSLRVLHLTKRVIELNAANYTAWELRREVLFRGDIAPPDLLQKLLHEEARFCREYCEEFPKNYQIWGHRRKLMDFLKSSTALASDVAQQQLRDRELEFVANLLSLTDDDKNYHAWAHRQYVWRAFENDNDDVLQGEIDFCDELLVRDVRNNSAWNHRFFVLTTSSKTRQVDVAREFAYVRAKVHLAGTNECAFNYLRGLLAQGSSSSVLASDEMLDWLQDVVVESEAAHKSNPPARSLLVDCLEQRGEHAAAAAQCVSLANTHDPIRRAYWLWRSSNN